MSTAHTAPDPVTFDTRRTCLFLDVDGTLVDFASSPDAVQIDQKLLSVLEAIHAQLGGALALISGRSLAQLDRLFAPLVLPAAGIHGFERRGQARVLFRPALAAEALDAVREQLAAYVLPQPGLLLEDKGAALALHYREAPEAEDASRTIMAKAARRLGSCFELLAGEKVFELRPAAPTKATAVEAFLKEEPFEGRNPIYIGDDQTDIEGFGAMRRNCGVDISVGERVSARWHLPDPSAVRAWLRRFATQSSSGRYRE